MTARAGSPTKGVSGAPPNDRAPLRERAALAVMLLGVACLARLPEGLAYGAARTLGWLAWRLQPARRELCLANLGRVCAHLAAAGSGSRRARAAAQDPALLATLGREAFEHWAMTYVESAMATRWGADELRRRVRLADPDVTGRALGPIGTDEQGHARGRIFVSLHLGSVELTGMYATLVGGLPVVAPMETVHGRVAAAYFERVRSRFGVSVVPAQGAAAALVRALEEGTSVGLVADRTVTGPGAAVPLFGAIARLPASPAVLAARTGATMFVLALLRTRRGRWDAHLVELEAPAGMPQREAARVLLERQVAVFEAFVGLAPEQWWTMLFPIWDDAPMRGPT